MGIRGLRGRMRFIPSRVWGMCGVRSKVVLLHVLYTERWAHSGPYSIVSEPARFCHNLLTSHSRAEFRQPHIPRWRCTSRQVFHAALKGSPRVMSPALTRNIRLIASSKSQTKRCLLQEIPPPPTQQNPAINYFVSHLSCISSIIASVSWQRVCYFESQSVKYWIQSEIR